MSKFHALARPKVGIDYRRKIGEAGVIISRLAAAPSTLIERQRIKSAEENNRRYRDETLSASKRPSSREIRLSGGGI